MSNWTQKQRVQRLKRNLQKRGYELAGGLEDYLSDLTEEDYSQITRDFLLQGAKYHPTKEVAQYMEKAGYAWTGEPLSPEEGQLFERRKSAAKGQRTKYRRQQTAMGAERKAQREQIKKQYYEKELTGVKDEELAAITRGTYILEDVRSRLKTWGMGDVLTGAHNIDENIRVNEYYINNYKKPHRDTLERILEGAISAYERQGLTREQAEMALAKRLEDNSTEVQDKINKALYGSGGEGGDQKIKSELTELANLIAGRPLSAAELDDISEYDDEADTEYEE